MNSRLYFVVLVSLFSFNLVGMTLQQGSNADIVKLLIQRGKNSKLPDDEPAKKRAKVESVVIASNDKLSSLIPSLQWFVLSYAIGGGKDLAALAQTCKFWRNFFGSNETERDNFFKKFEVVSPQQAIDLAIKSNDTLCQISTSPRLEMHLHQNFARLIPTERTLLELAKHKNVPAIEIAKKELSTAATLAFYSNDRILNLLMQSVKNKRSSLSDVFSFGSSDLIKLLLSKDLDKTFIDKEGRTLLINAIINNQEIIMQNIVSLLDKKIVDQADDKGNRALYYAALHGNSKIVDCLIKNGALAQSTNNKGETLLHAVVQDQTHIHTEDCLEYLLKSDLVTSINHKDCDGNTPLLSLFLNNHAEDLSFNVINLLKQAGARCDVTNNQGKNALHLLFEQNNNVPDDSTGGYFEHLATLVPEIIHSGCNVDQIDCNGDSVIHKAASKPWPAPIVHLLLHSVTQPMGQNNKGETVLHLAAKFNHLALSTLLAATAHMINVQDNEGNTALHYAAMKDCDCNTLAVNELHGSNHNIQNNEGKTPLVCALEYEQYDHARIIMNMATITLQSLKDAHAVMLAKTELNDKEREIFEILYNKIVELEADSFLKDK